MKNLSLIIISQLHDKKYNYIYYHALFINA